MTKKGIFLAAIALLVIAGAFWAKGYYNDRYVASSFYYTQIPPDEKNEDSWLVDADGVKQQPGKAYDLIGYDEKGETRALYFTQPGRADNYYAPGTYLKASASKTIVVGIEVVEEADVPPAALANIKKSCTRLR